MKESELITLLQHKYTNIRRGSSADRYVRASHVPYFHESGWVSRVADYMVLDTYSPRRLIGFEVKTSRADLLRELKEPDKASAWGKHCHQWYLVVSDFSIVDTKELPPAWGVLAQEDGKLATKRRASIVVPELLDILQIGQLGRSIAKTAVKEYKGA